MLTLADFPLNCFFFLLQKLSAELEMKEAKLLRLARNSEDLQGYSHVQHLAVKLSQHIKFVQKVTRQTAEDLKIRHGALQVLGNMHLLIVMLLIVFFESLQLLDSFLSTCIHSCCLHELLEISVF
jgi:hypothetical protein